MGSREMTQMRRRMLQGVALWLACIVIAPVAARAEDPLFVPWTEVLPGLTEGYDPSSDNICKKGHENCVHSVIKEMEQRFNPLAKSCVHNAVFSLTYLRTTEIYHEFWHEGHFVEENWMNHYDAVFGDYYFRAYDEWYKDRTGVPPAWQVAFNAAADRRVSGMGNVLLGMNAHINRDLPFVLAGIGLTRPDGSSRKPDHDKVNEFLNRVSSRVFPELARRFDPTISEEEGPLSPVTALVSFQAVPTWREQAWRNAERLVVATSDTERAAITAEIEEYSRMVAVQIRDGYAYNMFSSFKADDRDAYCAVNWDS